MYQKYTGSFGQIFKRKLGFYYLLVALTSMFIVLGFLIIVSMFNAIEVLSENAIPLLAIINKDVESNATNINELFDLVNSNNTEETVNYQDLDYKDEQGLRDLVEKLRSSLKIDQKIRKRKRKKHKPREKNKPDKYIKDNEIITLQLPLENSDELNYENNYYGEEKITDNSNLDAIDTEILSTTLKFEIKLENSDDLSNLFKNEQLKAISTENQPPFNVNWPKVSDKLKVANPLSLYPLNVYPLSNPPWPFLFNHSSGIQYNNDRGLYSKQADRLIMKPPPSKSPRKQLTPTYLLLPGLEIDNLLDGLNNDAKSMTNNKRNNFQITRLILNNKLTPDIIKEMKNMERTILSYPTRIKYNGIQTKVATLEGGSERSYMNKNRPFRPLFELGRIKA